MAKVECTCLRCGKLFSVFPSIIKVGGGKYCSRSCQNFRTGEARECEYCGSSFYIPRSSIIREDRGNQGRFCSIACKGKWQSENIRGKLCPNYKGGRFKRSDGYIAVYVGDSTYRLEHTLIMENHIGRRITRNENVHHINGIRDDNRIENLQLLTIADHAKEHHPGKDVSKWVECECLNCGKLFERVKSAIQERNFCSRACYVEHGAKKCACCGKEFHGGGKRRKFCSRECAFSRDHKNQINE